MSAPLFLTCPENMVVSFGKSFTAAANFDLAMNPVLNYCNQGQKEWHRVVNTAQMVNHIIVSLELWRNGWFSGPIYN